jgi:hypothetical protein
VVVAVEVEGEVVVRTSVVADSSPEEGDLVEDPVGRRAIAQGLVVFGEALVEDDLEAR